MSHMTKIVISLTCPKCAQKRPHDGYTEEQLRRWLTEGELIKGFCIECGVDWNASPGDRASVARALGMSRWD